MGMEWHERRRDKYGRFMVIEPAAPVQLHIRTTEARAALVRRAALAAKMDVGRYVAKAIDARLTADGYLTDGDDATTAGCTIGAPPAGGGVALHGGMG